AGSLIHLNFSNKRDIWPYTIDLARRVSEVAPHTRSLGSSALSQAYVAAGRLDANLKVTTGQWDIVGGSLLITEAGGIVTDLHGHPFREHASLLAAGPALHPLLIERIGDMRLP